MKRFALFLLVLSSTGVIALSKLPTAEMRAHYVVVGSNKLPVYDATVITRSDDDAGSETYLFGDPTGERIQIDIRRDYRKHTTTAEYSLNGAPPAKVSLQLPFKSEGRSSTLQESKTNPHLKDVEIPVTVESSGQSVITTESEWKHGSKRAEVRERAKGLLRPDLIASVTRLRSVLAFPVFGGACSTLPFVTDGLNCAASTALAVAAAPPDCQFDARFGLPCDNLQTKRAADRRRAGTTGSY